MTAVAEVRPVEITEPGVYDIPADVYHSDPVPGRSLSCSGAKKLLTPSCPAIFQWEREHGEPPRDVFDFGTAAHRQVLGVGTDIVEVEADDWKTKAAQEKRKAARAAGKVALLSEHCRVVEEMARRLREHPTAGALLDPDRAKPEQALFWHDPRHDVMRRAMVDLLPHSVTGKRAIVVDYKTAISASREAFTKAVYNYRYYIQARYYLDGVQALGLDEDPAFLFIVQEKTPPYLVNICQLDHDALRLGQQKIDDALATYAECTRTGHWPGYSDGIELISLPPWAS